MSDLCELPDEALTNESVNAAGDFESANNEENSADSDEVKLLKSKISDLESKNRKLVYENEQFKLE